MIHLQFSASPLGFMDQQTYSESELSFSPMNNLTGSPSSSSSSPRAPPTRTRLQDVVQERSRSGNLGIKEAIDLFDKLVDAKPNIYCFNILLTAIARMKQRLQQDESGWCYLARYRHLRHLDWLLYSNESSRSWFRHLWRNVEAWLEWKHSNF